MPRADIKSISIMISSTRDDLQEYRDRASEIIRRIADEKSSSIHIDDISMERENQSGEQESAVAVSKRWVTNSDWIILIVGFHYGSVGDDPSSEGLSVTEWEYRHAVSLNNKKIFVFMADDPDVRSTKSGVSLEDHNLKNWIDRTDRDKIFSFARNYNKAIYECFEVCQFFGTNSKEHSESTSTNSPDRRSGPSHSSSRRSAMQSRILPTRSN